MAQSARAPCAVRRRGHLPLLGSQSIMWLCCQVCENPLAAGGLARRGVVDGASALGVVVRYSERRKAFGQKIRRFERTSLRELLGRRGVVRNIEKDAIEADRLEEKVYE